MTKSLRSSVWSGLILFILLMWAVSTAQASLISFDLSIEFSGASSPEGTSPWLNATFEDTGVDEITLTLSEVNLTDSESVTKWMFNLDTAYDPTHLVFVEASRTGSFDTPSINTGVDAYKADGDGYFDILIDFATAGDATSVFGVGDALVYTITGITGLTAESFNVLSAPGGGAGAYETAAHVQRIGPDDQGSGWVGTPEPATLMLLAISAGMAVFFRKRPLRNNISRERS